MRINQSEGAENAKFVQMFFLIIVKHDLEESVEVFKGRNLDPLPPPPPTYRDRQKVKG